MTVPTGDKNWKIQIKEFYLDVYSGLSSIPPDDGDNAGKNLAYMTLIGDPMPDGNAPIGLNFYIYFFPDGSQLDLPQVKSNGDKTWVEMEMNVCQLAGVVAFLTRTAKSYAVYLETHEPGKRANIRGEVGCDHTFPKTKT